MSEKHERAYFGLNPTDAASYLRELADRVEAGQLDFRDAPVSLQQIKRIKVSLSPGPDGIDFEQKLKVRSDGSREASPGELKFKPLKKRMRRIFKAMKALVEEGHAPPLEMVERFASDTDRMIHLAKENDPGYPEFRAEVQRLQAALQEGDLDALASRLRTLRAMEHACHARYD
jgi:XXXCH domain-containing protein